MKTTLTAISVENVEIVCKLYERLPLVEAKFYRRPKYEGDFLIERKNMKKRNAMKWVKALRSGKFKQTNCTLVKTDKDGQPVGYCCLGVLGKISGLDEISKLKDVEFLECGNNEVCDLKSSNGTPLDNNEEGMPIVLSVKSGKTGKRIPKSFSNLAEANDSGVSFKSIASWIEKNFKYL